MNVNAKTTFDDLIDLLRSCPAEQLPATPESCSPQVSYPPQADAPAPDPPPDNSALSTSHSARTSLGTPRARSWDDAWLEMVNAAEGRLGRRICGARLIDGTPCELGSSHASGRCRFHGGFDLTGAPAGNRNAYIHGLYSRRLKTCGDHCPQWSTCPMVAADVEAVPLSKRPVCPFEEAEYNTALADALDLSCTVDNMNPFRIHIAHNIAILQVMLGRATTEMRNANVVSETRAQSDKYSFNHDAHDARQVRPHITAITRIGGELRKYLAFLAKSAPTEIKWDFYQDRRRWMRSTEPGPSPDQFQYVPPDEKKIAAQRAREATHTARKALTRAVLLANDNHETDAIEQWRQASLADPSFTDDWTTRLRKTVRARQRAAARSNPPP